MAKDDTSQQQSRAAAREQRLKAALKANMARRKAQSRARRAQEKQNHTGHENPIEEKS